MPGAAEDKFSMRPEHPSQRPPAAKLLHIALASAALCLSTGALAAQCTASSAATQTPLVELYTSEGCSSCPPADRWLSGLSGRTDVVALAFHGDYWDYIGWPDRFAEPRNSDRQREKVALAGSRSVYTPQVMVNGRDSRAWRGQDPLASVTRGTPANAVIELAFDTAERANTITVRANRTTPGAARIVLARYENGHQTAVKAGENRGATLRHDFVVREWTALPIAPGALLDTTVQFSRGTQAGGVVAFVEDSADGAVLQALALADCEG